MTCLMKSAAMLPFHRTLAAMLRSGSSTDCLRHPGPHLTPAAMPPWCVYAVWLPIAPAGIMLHSQTTSARFVQSSVQMLSRCVPASAKRGNSFVLCCLIIFRKRKQDSSCHLAVPFKHLTLSTAPVTAKDIHYLLAACHCRPRTVYE